ncbi:MAG: phosphoribosylaminoimidazolesuccinocarboxamide synthase [Fimbriimonadaceae bacterium]|nr:phosphoribosylaminoimidazolesuccinocarboxamide synthase [Fimbriimonadaceae bacterium]
MALTSTHLAQLGKPRTGKVREVYDLGSQLLIVTTDRISAFDVIMANGIPDKGRILNQMSAFWFEKFADQVPHHMISIDDAEVARLVGENNPELHGRCMISRKAQPLTIECVARGYICGSLYKEYVRDASVHDLGLPTGLVDGSKLPEPIFTPATKAEEGHDENISFARACDMVGREVAEQVRDWTLMLYKQAAILAAKAGLILADTKFEFGLTENGVIWIDEALSPDSSRYWEASLYAPGGPQPSFDKQYVRDYLETLNWDKTPPGPELPSEVVMNTRAKYVEAFERITGRQFTS